MPPSVTYWNRLEPRPRAPSITQPLAARIRDPLWMLTRQWQLGEFGGEDAGSPAYIEVSARIAPFAGWRHGAASAHTFSGLAPLEEVVETEPFTPDLSIRVELGQVFERLLMKAGVPELIADFRSAYPLPLLPQEELVEALFEMTVNVQPALDGGTIPQSLREAFRDRNVAFSHDAFVWARRKGIDWVIVDPASAQTYAVRKDGTTFASYKAVFPDQEAQRFLRVCAGRAIDGAALHEASEASASGIPATPVIDSTKQTAVKDALDALDAWIETVFGGVGVEDAPAWRSGRLEYELEVIGTRPSGPAGTNVLAARPGSDGGFDWDAFDLRQDQAAVAGVSPGTVEKKTLSVLPTHARFRGMPNLRWWDFEIGTTDFGDVRPDRRDLGKLVFMDFMLIAGNDWFVVPFDQPVGTVCSIASLIVHDVFGGETLVDRAEELDATLGVRKAGERWTMFSTTRLDKPEEVAPFFLLPPSAGAGVQVGVAVEEVRFLRDEMANMVWAVEESIENGVGLPWPGRERESARRPPAPPPSGAAEGQPPLRYQIQTTVPINWMPFIAVGIDPVNGRYALELTAMPDVLGIPITPRGRILQPSGLSGGAPYQVAEEEVSRAGTRVSRVVCRSRWLDGSTHVWISRRRGSGTGEGSSGLRFDLGVPNQ